MERIAIRELRNQASQVVRRARAGERLVITVDGVPAAEIGPVGIGDQGTSLPEQIAIGAVVAARLKSPAPPAKPVSAPSGRSSSEVLRQLRAR